MKQYNNIVVTGALGQDGIILSKILIKINLSIWNSKKNTKLQK